MRVPELFGRIFALLVWFEFLLYLYGFHINLLLLFILVYIAETKCVYCAIQTQASHTILFSSLTVNMFEIGIFRQCSLKISILDLRRTESSGTGISSLTGGTDFQSSFFVKKKRA